MSDHAAPSKWNPSPKFRRYLYVVGIALAALLVAYGLIDTEKVPLWVALLGAVLGISNGIAAGNVQDDK
jgi:hypothetical protein